MTGAVEPTNLKGTNRDAILVELMGIEGMLQDDRLKDHEGIALRDTQQALRNCWSRKRGTRHRRQSTGSTTGRAKRARCLYIERKLAVRALGGTSRTVSRIDGLIDSQSSEHGSSSRPFSL